MFWLQTFVMSLAIATCIDGTPGAIKKLSRNEPQSSLKNMIWNAQEFLIFNS